MKGPLSFWLGLAALLAFASSCRSWPEENVAAEMEMLDLVNDVRTAGVACSSGSLPAAPALEWNEELAWASRLHAEDMGQSGYFEHDSQDGRTPFERMEAEGYSGFPRAENIAAGSEGPAATLAQWLASDGHCVNLMDTQATCLGVGYARVEGSDWTHYWVQNFGVAAP